jgi:hypothetical protein
MCAGLSLIGVASFLRQDKVSWMRACVKFLVSPYMVAKLADFFCLPWLAGGKLRVMSIPPANSNNVYAAAGTGIATCSAAFETVK